jgi:hypothetical protein
MNIKNINDLANLDLNKITDPQELEAILAFLDHEIATAMKLPPPNSNHNPTLNPLSSHKDKSLPELGCYSRLSNDFRELSI